MRINKLVKIGERTEEKTRIIPATYDDSGNMLTEETTETYSVIVPIMKALSVEATEEEITEMSASDLSVAEIKDMLTKQVQDYMDSKAQERGYDDAFTCISYANEEELNPKFKAEGYAMLRWRSKVWTKCYAELDKYLAGERELPTDIIAELPKLEW